MECDSFSLLPVTILPQIHNFCYFSQKAQELTCKYQRVITIGTGKLRLTLMEVNLLSSAMCWYCAVHKKAELTLCCFVTSGFVLLVTPWGEKDALKPKENNTGAVGASGIEVTGVIRFDPLRNHHFSAEGFFPPLFSLLGHS